MLNMLLEHISVQLQQNAEVDTPVTRHGDLTSGVKVMTYLSCIDHQATVPQSAQGDEGVAHVGIDNRPFSDKDSWRSWETSLRAGW